MSAITSDAPLSDGPRTVCTSTDESRERESDFDIATTPSGDRSIMGPGSLLREAWEVIPILLLLAGREA